MGARDLFLEQYSTRQASLPGAAVADLRATREAALAQFAQVGIPTTRDEDWKYTSIAALDRRGFSLANADLLSATTAKAGVADPAAVQLTRRALTNSHRMVFVNGRYQPQLSRLTGLPGGVSLHSLAVLAETSPARLARQLADAAGFALTAHANDSFGWLNGALWTDGAWLEIADGTVVERPIELLYLATRGDAANFTRTMIDLGAGARATIVEHYVGSVDAAYLTDAVTEFALASGARLTHAKLQEEGPRAYHIAALRGGQGEGSTLTSHSFAFGGLLARTAIDARLEAPDCAAHLLGLIVGAARQHIDHHTRIDHLRPRGLSREAYHAILDDHARVVFNGRVVVHPGAQQTDARQSSRNLLLADTAEVDTKPQLEIFADDVKCMHGASVGQLDAEQLEYLRVRGIGETAARALLVYGFAAELLDQIACGPLRARVAARLIDRAPAEVKELLCDTPTRS